MVCWEYTLIVGVVNLGSRVVGYYPNGFFWAGERYFEEYVLVRYF